MRLQVSFAAQEAGKDYIRLLALIAEFPDENFFMNFGQ